MNIYIDSFVHFVCKVQCKYIQVLCSRRPNRPQILLPLLFLFLRGVLKFLPYFLCKQYSGIDHFNVYLEKETNRPILHTFFVIIGMNSIQCQTDFLAVWWLRTFACHKNCIDITLSFFGLINGFPNKFLNGFWNRFLNRLLNRFLNRILNEFLNRFLSGFPNGFLNRFPNLSVHSSFSDSLILLCYLNGGLLSKFILTLLIFILVYIQGIYNSFFRFGSYLIKN